MATSSRPLFTASEAMREVARQGALALPLPVREKTALFVQGQWAGEGGFRNRQGISDLYYTWFGLVCLEALGLPLPEAGAARFLLSFSQEEDLDMVHLASLIRCRALLPSVPSPPGERERLLERLDSLRVPGGGYRLRARAQGDSIYASFIAGLAWSDVGRTMPDPAGILRCLAALRTPDGGYADFPALEVGTTTVTAAATVIRSQLGERPDPVAVLWLRNRHHSDGGFLASPLAPMPDLLSTTTALFALLLAGQPLAPFRPTTREFVDSMLWENGGFTGHLLDETPDCEYTFYALLGLGLLAGDAP